MLQMQRIYGNRELKSEFTHLLSKQHIYEVLWLQVVACSCDKQG